MKTPVIALLSLLMVVAMAATPSQASLPGTWEPTFAKLRGSTIELIDLPDVEVVSRELMPTKYSMSGMIEDVDPTGLRVTILNNMGQKESLPVTKASVLEGVGQGDRVSYEMNADGKITKIVKTTPIPQGSPAPEPQG